MSDSLPTKVRIEYADGGPTHASHSQRVSMVTDWAAYYADVPNHEYWHDMARIAYKRLVQMIGEPDASDWAIATITCGQTWKASYELVNARIMQAYSDRLTEKVR